MSVRSRVAALRRSAVPVGSVTVLLAVLVGAGGGWAAASVNHPNVLPLSTGVRPVVVPISPCRLADTRPGVLVGPRSTPIGSAETYTLTATGAQGACAVPVGAVGLVLNVTVLHGTKASFLTVWPADQVRPSASNLNWVAGQAPTPNQVTVGLSTAGQLSVYNSAGTVDLLVDVVGYLADHNFDDRYYTKTQVDAQPPPNPQRVATLHWYAANQATTITVSAAYQSSAIAFDGANMWVTVSANPSSVVKIRASDDAILGSYPVGLGPDGLAYDGANMWVANGTDNTVSKIRASDGTSLGTFPVGKQPTGVAFDGTNVWVTNSGDATVTKLRAATGASLGVFPVGAQPIGIAFDGANLWVTDQGSSSVTELRASDGATLGTFAVGSQPQGVAFDGSSVWIANLYGNSITRLRASDGALLATYPLGANAGGLAFDGQNMWVINGHTSNVTELRGRDGANLGTYSAGAAPVAIAFDGAEVWVVNWADGTLSKF